MSLRLRALLTLLVVLILHPLYTRAYGAVYVTPPGTTCVADPRLQSAVPGQDYCLQSTDSQLYFLNGTVWTQGTGAGIGAAGTVLTGTGAASSYSSFPGVLGLSTFGQNAIVIGPYDVNAGNTGELHLLELAANGSNYVGFKARDSLAGNKIWTLPAADGTNNQVIVTDGAGNLSFATVSGGTPGVTSLNALAGVLTLAGSTNIGVASGGSTITLTLLGPVAPSLGGTGISTAASTGVPGINAGTWSVLTGAADTVLHGNRVFGHVALDTEVTGTLQAANFPALTGDVTTPGGGLTTTLSSTGVSAGSYGLVTVDVKGRVTAAALITDVAHGGTGIGSGAGGGVLAFTGATTIVSSGTLTANALVLGGGSSAAPSTLASLGTTTTVLHGNAAGAPSFSAVSLTADVTGNLPVTNLNNGTNATNVTFWRGDGTWQTPAGAGTVTSSGPPANNQIARFTTTTNITGSGTLTFDGSTFGVTGTAAVTGPLTVAGSVAVTDPSAVSTSQITFDGSASSSGINVKLVGNGGATPKKWIRVSSGTLQVLNDAYSTVLMSLSDVGSMALTGNLATSGAGGVSIHPSGGNSQGVAFYTASNAHAFAILANDSTAADVLLRWPPTLGSNGQTWVNDGSGNMAWATLPVLGGGTGLTVGVSGGVPYFSSTTTMGSSTLLPLNAVVLGGGAASPPFTRSGLTYDGTTLTAVGSTIDFNNGASDILGIKLTGTGSNKSKWLRAGNGGSGNFEVINNAYTVALLQLQDSGNLVLPQGSYYNSTKLHGAAYWAGTGELRTDAVFNVQSYGATGAGFPTDDAAAIQSAVTAASAAGGSIYFPPGVYYVASTIVVAPGFGEIRGHSSASILEARSNMVIMELRAGSGEFDNIHVHHLLFRTTDSNATGILLTGVSTNFWHYGTFDHLWFQGLQYGIRSTKPNGVSNGAQIDWYHWNNLYFTDGVKNAIYFDFGTGTGNIFSDIMWALAANGTGLYFGAPGNIGQGDLTISNVQAAGTTGCTGIFFTPNPTGYKERITIMSSQFDGTGVSIDMRGYVHVVIWGISWGGGTTRNLTGTTGWASGTIQSDT